MGELLDILKTLDWSPLFISLKTGIVATVVCFFLGVWAAHGVLRLGPRARAVVDGFLTLPMVLPPTVAGFFLLLLFSLRRPFGGWLYGTFGIKVVQSWAGCVIAASVIAFPLMYRNARAAFEQVDIAGKTGTISQKIAMVIQNGDYATAGVWVAIIMLISFGIVVIMNLISGRKIKNQKHW